MNKAEECIAQLENNAASTGPPPAPAPHNTEVQMLMEEVKAQAALTAKAKRATTLAETEIDRLKLELCQSSNREGDIRAKGCKAVKTLQEKLHVEVAAHGRTKEEKEKLQEEARKKETVIMTLRELAQKKKVWYEEQHT